MKALLGLPWNPLSTPFFSQISWKGLAGGGRGAVGSGRFLLAILERNCKLLIRKIKLGGEL